MGSGTGLIAFCCGGGTMVSSSLRLRAGEEGVSVGGEFSGVFFSRDEGATGAFVAVVGSGFTIPKFMASIELFFNVNRSWGVSTCVVGAYPLGLGFVAVF